MSIIGSIKGTVRGAIRNSIVAGDYVFVPPTDPYPNSWVNADGSVNCDGIVYCDQPIPCFENPYANTVLWNLDGTIKCGVVIPCGLTWI